MLKKFYTNIIFKHSLLVSSLLLIIFTFLLYNSTKLKIDASAETLLLEDDRDLVFSRLISKRYDNQNILVIAYSPKSDLLSNKTLDDLSSFVNELEKLPLIKNTSSILNVPLLQSPVLGLSDLTKELNTINNNKDINKTLVKNEFLTSPLYKNQLVSSDFKTTAILLNIKKDQKLISLLEKRKYYREKEKSNTLNNSDKNEFELLKTQLKQHRDIAREQNHDNIQNIRNIIAKHTSNASIFLGGIDMITDDIVSFVKGDLKTYGIALIFILALVLYIIFKKLLWVFIPLVICVISVGATSGTLALFSWEITVISSNFIAMQLIITLSIVLHLIVRYNELITKYPKSSQKRLLLNTLLSKANPSFFAIITTIAGFSSLVFSNIQPVINLGYMMSIGIFLSLIISFIVFPLILVNLQKISIKKENLKDTKSFSITSYTSNLVLKYPKKIFIITFIFIIFGVLGSSKLIVENSFISYFKQNTAIFQGMKVIDTKLGGTTPLDIILTFKSDTIIKDNTTNEVQNDEDSFDDEFESQENSEQYWFTKEKMDKILKVHNYLQNLDEIGKVQSFATLLKLGKIINENKDLDSFKLAILYQKLPKKYKDIILSPYINIEQNQVRFSTRIVDSNPNLRRNELINKIKTDLALMLKDDKIQLSNVMILYNNMLQSLFNSQIKTLGFVLVILFIMFILLFKSFKIALISIISNIIPILVVFAIMGFLHIPLDIMTITIAAISIGIGVDDTIHYIHRYKEEYQKDKNYNQAMIRAHKSIGNAMTYTSIAVILGFLVLVLSNLIPTIYFGLLTVFVMITILTSALILLPRLLINFKSFS